MKKEYSKLYQKASTGKIKVWEVFAEGDSNSASITISHGEDGGKLIIDKRDVQGKNIGRSNETTPFEQACKEAQSRWNKKKDRDGYSISTNCIDYTSDFISAMLAYRYQDRSKDVVYPCFTQPKLNGLRDITKYLSYITHQSRKNVLWNTLEHLNDDLNKIFKYIFLPLDGEIFHPEIDIQDINALVKKFHGDDDPVGNWKTTDLQYWIYDTVDATKNFNERSYSLKNAFIKSGAIEFEDGYKLNNLIYVPTYECKSEAEILTLHKKFTSDGFEGTMIRNNVPYVIGHRTKHLLKLKNKIDNEFIIIGGKEGTGRDSGTIIFRCITDDGNEFDVRPKGSIEQRRKWLDNLDKLIGKKLNCEYQEISHKKIPIHCRGIYIRDYE